MEPVRVRPDNASNHGRLKQNEGIIIEPTHLKMHPARGHRGRVGKFSILEETKKYE